MAQKLTPAQLAEAGWQLAEAQQKNPCAYLEWDPQAGEIKVYKTYAAMEDGQPAAATVKLR